VAKILQIFSSEENPNVLPFAVNKLLLDWLDKTEAIKEEREWKDIHQMNLIEIARNYVVPTILKSSASRDFSENIFAQLIVKLPYNQLSDTFHFVPTVVQEEHIS